MNYSGQNVNRAEAENAWSIPRSNYHQSGARKDFLLHHGPPSLLFFLFIISDIANGPTNVLCIQYMPDTAQTFHPTLSCGQVSQQQSDFPWLFRAEQGEAPRAWSAFLRLQASPTIVLTSSGLTARDPFLEMHSACFLPQGR